ncbi:MAG: tRNA (adenosine(37)-N6)-dimethylallyltransferase MiaA [Bacteroidia bacterium]
MKEKNPQSPFRDLGQAGDKSLIVILGPTAVGKTAAAIHAAKELGTEIISADSRQFFKEMNIGTAKPSEEELRSVKHHFINSLSIHDEYNVGMFERDALNVLDKIFQKKNTAVMVGGSGLYINAVCNGFDEVPEADKEIRAGITALYKHEGIEYLQSTLKKLDEEHYKKIDIKNPHRLIRAIEVCMITGKTYSELRKGEKQKRNFTVIKIGLTMEREKLYQKINERVDKMMAEGLLQEVIALAPFRAGGKLNSLQTVGYKELFNHLDVLTSANAQSPFRQPQVATEGLGHAIDLIKQNTRNFAKRQMTWFRKDKEINWFDASEKEKMMQYIRNSTV